MQSVTGRNHALWLAPILALFGFLSYYALFARWPIFRDVPWLNLLILAAAVGLSISGLRRALPNGLLQRSAGVFGAFLASGLTLLLMVYCFGLSYQLPSAELAAERGEPIPALVLAAHDGADFDLGAGDHERMVLVFYRGHW